MKWNEKWSKATNPYYPDVQLFLILIPFIAGFNYVLTYPNPQLNWYLLITFLIDVIDGYIAVWCIRQLVLYLDEKLPYQGQVVKRLWVQTVSILLLGCLVIAFLTELVCIIVRGRMVPLKFYTHDLPIISIWFFVVSGIYTVLYFYNEWRKSEQQQLDFELQLKEGLIVKHRNRNIKLDFPQIAGFTVDGDYAICLDQEGNKFYIEKSLNKIHADLPELLFYRANRQYIINRSIITGFKSTTNGKLIAFINHARFPSEIPISRTKAAAFKQWFHNKT